MLLNRSRGELGGKPFAQHCSCPACFRCSVHRTVAASLGTIFVYESCFLAQWLVSHRTRQQGGSVEPPWSFAYQASLARSLPVAQKENRKQNLRHFEFSKTGYAKKIAVAIFS